MNITLNGKDYDVHEDVANAFSQLYHFYYNCVNLKKATEENNGDLVVEIVQSIVAQIKV